MPDWLNPATLTALALAVGAWWKQIASGIAYLVRVRTEASTKLIVAEASAKASTAEATVKLTEAEAEVEHERAIERRADNRQVAKDYRIFALEMKDLVGTLQKRFDDSQKEHAKERQENAITIVQLQRDREDCRAENAELQARIAALEAEVERLKGEK